MINDPDQQRMKATGKRMLRAAFEDEEARPGDIFFGALDVIGSLMAQFPEMREPGIEVMKNNADSYASFGIPEKPKDNVVKLGK